MLCCVVFFLDGHVPRFVEGIRFVILLLLILLLLILLLLLLRLLSRLLLLLLAVVVGTILGFEERRRQGLVQIRWIEDIGKGILETAAHQIEAVTSVGSLGVQHRQRFKVI